MQTFERRGPTRLCQNKNCTNSLELFHRSRLYCNEHKYNSIKRAPLDIHVSISITDLKSLIADRDRLEEIERMFK